MVIPSMLGRELFDQPSYSLYVTICRQNKDKDKTKTGQSVLSYMYTE